MVTGLRHPVTGRLQRRTKRRRASSPGAAATLRSGRDETAPRRPPFPPPPAGPGVVCGRPDRLELARARGGHHRVQERLQPVCIRPAPRHRHRGAGRDSRPLGHSRQRDVRRARGLVRARRQHPDRRWTLRHLVPAPLGHRRSPRSGSAARRASRGGRHHRAPLGAPAAPALRGSRRGDTPLPRSARVPAAARRTARRARPAARRAGAGSGGSTPAPGAGPRRRASAAFGSPAVRTPPPAAGRTPLPVAGRASAPLAGRGAAAPPGPRWAPASGPRPRAPRGAGHRPTARGRSRAGARSRAARQASGGPGARHWPRARLPGAPARGSLRLDWPDRRRSDACGPRSGTGGPRSGSGDRGTAAAASRGVIARSAATRWIASTVRALLRHHTDLLRQRAAPPRARLHHDRGRRARAAHALAGRGRLLPDGDGRARRAGHARGREPRHHAARAG